jgi:hypothetical protein
MVISFCFRRSRRFRSTLPLREGRATGNLKVLVSVADRSGVQPEADFQEAFSEYHVSVSILEKNSPQLGFGLD